MSCDSRAPGKGDWTEWGSSGSSPRWWGHREESGELKDRSECKSPVPVLPYMEPSIFLALFRKAPAWREASRNLVPALAPPLAVPPASWEGEAETLSPPEAIGWVSGQSLDLPRVLDFLSLSCHMSTEADSLPSQVQNMGVTEIGRPPWALETLLDNRDGGGWAGMVVDQPVRG